MDISRDICNFIFYFLKLLEYQIIISELKLFKNYPPPLKF